MTLITIIMIAAGLIIFTIVVTCLCHATLDVVFYIRFYVRLKKMRKERNLLGLAPFN